jgi:hypothetical protein
MPKLVIAELRQKIDLEGKYVDFNLLRSTVTVEELIRGLEIKLSSPSKDNECRAKCSKCGKDRSFCLNIATNRFNCFAKGCDLKGGGVIDFFAKLHEVSAKEASHLLACAYGIAPYNSETMLNEIQPVNQPANETQAAKSGEAIISAATPADNSPTVPPITTAHLIASIEHQLAQLKKLLASS